MEDAAPVGACGSAIRLKPSGGPVFLRYLRQSIIGKPVSGTNVSMPSQASVLGIRVDAKAVIGVAVFAAVGVLLATYPVEFLGAAAALFSLTRILRVALGRLEFWQILVLVTLAAYGILNYGFDNLAGAPGALPMPVGELLMLLALGMVLLGGRSRSLSQFLRDPP